MSKSSLMSKEFTFPGNCLRLFENIYRGRNVLNSHNRINNHLKFNN